MKMWAEIRTAYKVAELGTVSAAAQTLGLHRATVVRHIETLEKELESKIFQRHGQGYETTEVGEDLLKVGRRTEEEFNQLVGRTRNRSASLSGELIVTSHEHIAPLLLPALARFQNENPDTSIKFVASADVLKLEYGVAHFALRAGSRPSEQDNIVSQFTELKFGFYAHKDYIKKHGMPDDVDQFSMHNFVRWDTNDLGMPFTNWFEEFVPKERIVISSTNLRIAEQSILLGMGLGFFPDIDAVQYDDLVNVIPHQPTWKITLWSVTHVDLHRTSNVQAFRNILKEL